MVILTSCFYYKHSQGNLAKTIELSTRLQSLMEQNSQRLTWNLKCNKRGNVVHVNLTDYLINVTQFVSSQKFELTYQVLFCKCVDIVTRWICWHPSSLMNTFCCELDTFQRQFAVVHIYSSASLRKAKKSFATSLPWLKSHMLSRIHFTELK